MEHDIIRKNWFAPKWKWLKRFLVLAMASIALSLALYNLNSIPFAATIAFASLFCGLVPLVFWLSFIPILHWKDRYKGNHPNLWGAFMVFETSGWTRIFYWFAHVIPDSRGSGVYALADDTSA